MTPSVARSIRPRPQRAIPLALVIVVLAVPVGLVPLLSGTATASGTAPGSANTWVPTGSMVSARAGQTATLLEDGKVLVTGGGSATADLYDPTTGAWSATGSLSVARVGATATLLQNGKVLVAGGCCTGSDALASAELYDPTTGTWSPTGRMTIGRWGQTATLLPDGDVLIAGGLACEYQCGTATFFNTLRSAELYDPATGTFTRTGSMHDFRQLQTATLLPDHEVLVTGGFSGCDDDFCSDEASAELYDPTTGSWTRTGSMHVAREQQTASLLPDGEVLVAGGITFDDTSGPGAPEKSAELYDPTTGTFSTTASMAVTHVGGAAATLHNGWVLVAGGGTTAAELYQPSRGIWVSPGAMLTLRTDLTLTTLPDGSVLAAGGDGPDGAALASAERFLAGPGPLVLLGSNTLSFPTQLVGTSSPVQTVSVTNEGTLPLSVSGAAVGGADPSDFDATSTCGAGPLAPGSSCTVSVGFVPVDPALRKAEVSVVDDAPLDPQQIALSGHAAGPNTWAPTGSMATARDGFASAVLPDGRVLVAGGETALTPLRAAEVWDPVSGTWGATSPLAVPRAFDTAITLGDGEVLVVGGYGANFVRLATAVLYDPATGTWTPTGSMHESGSNLTATLLPDGDVLVTGQGGDSAEVYDPSTGSWTDTGPTVAPQYLASAVLLHTGDVLVTGGGSAAAELYDPATNDWSATGSLLHARQSGTATLLPDGDVLVAGGEPPGGGTPLADAELYHPKTGTFTEAQPMLGGRAYQNAILLSEGVVMVAGGCTGSCEDGDTLATTEFYGIQEGYWFSAPPMTVARQGFGALLLAEGSVLAVGGSTSNCCADTATAEVYRVPSISLSPAGGPVGQTVTVRGFGFDAGEPVVVGFGTGSSRRTTTTSAIGTFLATVTVPPKQPGPARVRAVAQRSDTIASAVFEVTGP